MASICACPWREISRNASATRCGSFTSGREPRASEPFFAKVENPGVSFVLLPKRNRLVANNDPGGSRRRGFGNVFGDNTAPFGKEDLTEVDGRARSRVERHRADLLQRALVGQNHTPDRPVRRNGNAVHRQAPRHPQRLIHRHQRHIQLTALQTRRQRRRVVQNNRPVIRLNQRPGIQITHTAHAQPPQCVEERRFHGQVSPASTGS